MQHSDLFPRRLLLTKTGAAEWICPPIHRQADRAGITEVIDSVEQDG